MRLRNSEVLRTGDAAEKADIVATNDQNVFPGFQHSGSNPMRPGELPIQEASINENFYFFYFLLVKANLP